MQTGSAAFVRKGTTRRSSEHGHHPPQHFADRGGVGYSYLLDTFAPLASEAGVPDRAWENLLYRNALRIYKGQK